MRRVTSAAMIGAAYALAEPALASAIEVFAANGVDIMIDERAGYTPLRSSLVRS